MKATYIVFGIIAITVGVASWCGFEMNRVAAGCYAITAGIMFISEACKVK